MSCALRDERLCDLEAEAPKAAGDDVGSVWIDADGGSGRNRATDQARSPKGRTADGKLVLPSLRATRPQRAGILLDRCGGIEIDDAAPQLWMLDRAGSAE